MSARLTINVATIINAKKPTGTPTNGKLAISAQAAAMPVTSYDRKPARWPSLTMKATGIVGHAAVIVGLDRHPIAPLKDGSTPTLGNSGNHVSPRPFP